MIVLQRRRGRWQAAGLRAGTSSGRGGRDSAPTCSRATRTWPASVSHSVPRPPEVLKASYSVPSSEKCSRPSSGSTHCVRPSRIASHGWQYSLIRPSTLHVRLYFSALVGKFRQRADAHLDVAHVVEALRQVVRDDADEARRETALRHERVIGVVGDRADRVGGAHVLGQVEVVARRRALRRRRDVHREVVRQRVDERVETLHARRAARRHRRNRHGGSECPGRRVCRARAGRGRTRRRRSRRFRAACGRWCDRSNLRQRWLLSCASSLLFVLSPAWEVRCARGAAPGGLNP